MVIPRVPEDGQRVGLAWGVLALLCLAASGCTRTYYRHYADNDVYGIESERAFDWRWRAPDRPVEAAPKSRIGDPFNPDREPIPPDDPGARAFQVSNGRPFEFHGWKKRGKAPIELLGWQACLPMDAKGSVVLSPAAAMQIAVANSREYQTEVENVYLQALALTLARFQFMVQGYGGQSTFFNHFGSKQTDSNQLRLGTNDGFNLQLQSGAQIVADFANSLVWEYHGKGFHAATSSLLVGVTQPLLRGAFLRIVTQQLSLSERQTLYTIRDFARYRRGFYVGVVAGDGYLGLLTQLQAIRNQESNIAQLKRNLDEYEELVKAGFSNPLERDLIAQQYQQAQFSLISSQAALQTQLDQYKVLLGLPPDTPVELDDTILKTFELNDPRLDDLRTRNDRLYLSLLQYNENNDERPPVAELGATARQLRLDFQDLQAVHTQATGEMARWQARIVTEKARPRLTDDDRKGLDRQAELAGALRDDLREAGEAIAKDVRDLTAYQAKLGQANLAEAFQSIRDMVGKGFRGRLSEVFVAQTQTRVFLVELPPVDLTLDEAIKVAFENRLDLMNAQGTVTDEWRNEEVAANALRGGLNLVYQGNLATAPGRFPQLVRLDNSASSHRVGIQFDAPINRRAERNAYRTQQITFQRARRSYMETHDEVLREIRLDMRQLNLSRRQFEIGREQLLIASRQVDQAEYNLRNSTAAGGGGGQSNALALLSVLQSLLTTKNGLITTWVGYETARLSLYRDFDTMDIDAQGVWTNEPRGTASLAAGNGPGPSTVASPATGSPDTDAGAPNLVPPPPPPGPGTPGPFSGP